MAQTHQPNARWRQRFLFRAGIRANILIFTVAAQRRIYTGLSPFFQLRHDGKASKAINNFTQSLQRILIDGDKKFFQQRANIFR